MATQTKTLWTGFDPASGNMASIAFDYDDALLRILSFTITNPTSKGIMFQARSIATGRIYSGNIEASTGEQVIPINNANAQNRLQASLTPSGKLDGIEYSINFG